MTYGLVEAERAAFTVASYIEKNVSLIEPPKVGVISCHARN